MLAVAFDGRLGEIMLLEPNHLGDFLAGVFGPIAIVWLILGFFQQARELRLNSRALKEQDKSLKMAGEEHRELLRVMKEQLEATREQVRLERERAAAGESSAARR
jgi:hypothetical protein